MTKPPLDRDAWHLARASRCHGTEAVTCSPQISIGSLREYIAHYFIQTGWHHGGRGRPHTGPSNASTRHSTRLGPSRYTHAITPHCYRSASRAFEHRVQQAATPRQWAADHLSGGSSL